MISRKPEGPLGVQRHLGGMGIVSAFAAALLLGAPGCGEATATTSKTPAMTRTAATARARPSPTDTVAARPKIETPLASRPARDQAFGAELAGLREAALRAGTLQWEDGARARVSLFRRLADTLASFDVRTERMRRTIASIRAEAAKLTRTSPMAWNRSAHLHVALLAAVRALDEVSRQEGGVATNWVAAARSAANTVKAYDLVDFQRPQIQDALRSIVDTVAALHDGHRAVVPGANSAS
jgi:hypothetical protein